MNASLKNWKWRTGDYVHDNDYHVFNADMPCRRILLRIDKPKLIWRSVIYYGLDYNDTDGIPLDNHILVPYGSMPSAGTGLCRQVHKREEIDMKMVDDTPLLGDDDVISIVKRIIRYCRLCEDLELDYQGYVDKDELLIIQKQLECVLDNRDKVKKL